MNSTWVYNWRTSEWKESTPLSVGRGSHGCALVGSQVLVGAGFGGENFGEALSSVERYDPITAVWTLDSTLPKLTDYRSYFREFLSSGEEVYALAHYSDKVWKRNGTAGVWLEMDWISLGSIYDSSYDTAILVPHDFLATCDVYD